MGSVMAELCEKAAATAALSAAYAVSLKLKISNVVSITAKETKSLMIVSCLEIAVKQDLLRTLSVCRIISKSVWSV